MDKGLHAGIIFVDLQKTFDTLDYDVLLEKMECMGFKKPVIKWFKSCLSNRNFFCVARRSFFGRSLNYMRSSTRFYSGTTLLFNIY